METSREQEPSIPAPLDFLDHAEKIFRPKHAETFFMAKSLMERKGWTVKHLSLASGIPTVKLHRMIQRSGEQMALSVCEQRCIWFLWIQDVAPAVLMSYQQIVEWGRGVTPIFEAKKFSEIPLEDRKRMIIILEKFRNEANPLRLHEVAARLGVTQEAARELCNQSAYLIHDEPNHIDWIPRCLLPGSVWREVDWNHNDLSISDRLGVSVDAVKTRRFQIQDLADDGALDYALTLVGANKKFFRIFFQKTS